MRLETNPSYQASYDLHLKAVVMMSKVAIVACELYGAFVASDQLEVSRLRMKIADGLGMTTKHLLEADTASPHPTLKKLAREVATLHEESEKLPVPNLKSKIVRMVGDINDAAGV